MWSSSGNRSTGGTVITREEAVDGARRRGHELAVEAHHLGRLLDRPERRARHHGGADRVRAELERGDDAEVAAAAAQRPEQVGVLVGAGVHLRAVGQHHVGADQAVDREPEAARQVAEAAAEREPADAGGRDDPRRRRAAVLGGGLVDLPPGAAAPDADACRARDRRPRRPCPARSMTSAVVDDAEAAAVVSAAAYRDRRCRGRARTRCSARRRRRSRSARSPPDGGRSCRCGRRGPRRSPDRRARRCGRSRSASSRRAVSASDVVAVMWCSPV